MMSLDRGWRHRQNIKRGITRKVKLTQGHFIAEYAVPTAVSGATEPRYTLTNTTEFSYVSFSLLGNGKSDGSSLSDTCGTLQPLATRTISLRPTVGL